VQQKFGPEHWAAETKLAVISECAELSGSELFRYCQRMSLTVELVRQWQRDCLVGLEKKAASKAMPTGYARLRQISKHAKTSRAATSIGSATAIWQRLASCWGSELT